MDARAKQFDLQVNQRIKQLDIEIKRLADPRAGLESDLPRIYADLLEVGYDLGLPAKDILGVAPIGYACVPRLMAITLCQEFRGQLEQAKKQLGNTPTELPRITLSPSDAEIEFNGKVYSRVPLLAAEALKAICDQHPLPCGLNRAIGPHPERVVKKLPRELEKRVRSLEGNKGYIFVL